MGLKFKKLKKIFGGSFGAAKFLTRMLSLTLTLFYTRGLGIVVLYVMVPQPYRFSLRFFT